MPSTAQLMLAVGEKGTEETKRKVADLSDHVKKTGGFFKTALSSAIGFAGGALAVNAVGMAAGFLVGQMKDVIAQGMSQQAVMSETTNTLAHMGKASGQTADSIGDFADHMAQLTGVSDDVIQHGENVMLTFGNIGKNVFPAATTAALNMSTMLKTDLQSSILQVGKALNDPIKGVAALAREGVSFSDAEKESIKTMMAHKNIAGADAIVMSELNKQFGGAAVAAGTTFGGQMARLNVVMDQTKEKIGLALLPVLQQLMTNIQPLIGIVGRGLTGAITNLMPLFDNLGPLIGKVAGFVMMLLPHVLSLGQTFAQHLQPALAGIGGLFTSLGSKLGSINLTGIFSVLGTVAGFLGDVLAKVAGFITGQVVPAVISLAQWFGAHVLPIITQLAGIFVTTLLPALQHLFAVIMANVVPAIEHLWNVLAPKLVPVLQLVGWILSNVVGPALGLILPIIGFLIDAIAGLIDWIFHLGDGLKAVGGFFAAAWNGAKAVTVTVLGTVASFISGVWTGIVAGVQTFANQIKANIQAGFNLAKTIIQDAINFIVGLFKFLFDHNTYFHDLVVHIQQEFKLAQQIVVAVWTFISNFLTQQWNGIKTAALFIWHAITSFIQLEIDGVKKIITVTLGAISAVWNAVWGAVSATVARTWQHITGQVQEGINLAKAPITILGTWLGTFFGNLATTALDWGKNLIMGFINGIKTQAGQLKTAVGDVIGGAAKALGFHDIKIPGFADGGIIAQGGIAMVGERGPELVALAGGSRVYSAQQSQQILAGGSGGGGGQGATQHIQIILDGRVLTETVVRSMPAVVRLATGGRV